MRKKIPIILTLIAPIFFATSLPNTAVFAQMVTDGGETVWSVDELAAFTAEIKNEREAVCGSDNNCKIDYYFEQMGRGGFYSAADLFSNSSLILTAINPEKGTLRLLFHDNDPQMDLWEGTAHHYPMTELYLVWMGPEITSHIYFVDEIRSGHDIEGLHVIYAANWMDHEPGWFPTDTEVEIFAPDAQLSANTTGLLDYSMMNEPLGRAGSLGNYSECLNSPDYRPGMECRLYYYASGSTVYLPVSTDEVSDNTTDEPGTLDEPDSSNIPNNLKENNLPSEIVTEEAEFHVVINIATEDNSGVASHTDSLPASSLAGSQNRQTTNPDSEQPSAQIAVVPTDADIEPKSELNQVEPATTVQLPLSGNCEEGNRFPWWFIVLVASCDALIMWLFWPHKNHKVSQKV